MCRTVRHFDAREEQGRCHNLVSQQITGTQNDGARPPSRVCCGDRVTSVARPLRIPTLGGGSIQFRSRLIPSFSLMT